MTTTKENIETGKIYSVRIDLVRGLAKEDYEKFALKVVDKVLPLDEKVDVKMASGKVVKEAYDLISNIYLQEEVAV